MQLKIFSNSFLSLAVICTAMIASSCKDDDDKGSAPQGPIVTYDGNLLTKVGSYTLHYDDKGRCTSVSDNYGDEEFSIDYEAGELIYGDDDFEMPYKVSFTNEGYFSKVWMSYSGKEDGISFKVEGSVTFSYDSSGHLTSGKSSSALSVSGNGMSYSEKNNSEGKYTWKNGNLTTVYMAESGYDEEDGEWGSTTTVNLNYSDAANEFKQWTFAMEDATDASEMAGFAGLIGVGTANLISSYTENYTDEDGRDETYTGNVSYQLNSNGTISKETIGGRSYSYTYTTYTGETSKAGKTEIESEPRYTDMLVKLHRNIQKYFNKIKVKE